MHPALLLHPRASHAALPGLLLLVIAAGAPIEARAQHMTMAGHASDRMDDLAMRRMLEERYGSRTAQSAQASGARAVTATFLAGPSNSFRFDADGSLTTVVDTVHITTGDAVKWQWVSGFHTVTSGTGSLDPNMGALFDSGLDSTTPTFTFTFAQAGTYPFFCQFHESLNMRGVVVVTDPASVPESGTGLGFSAAPAPNPTRADVSVRFGVAQPGRARLDVLDANGRQVAVALDSWLDAGPHAVTWDGRTGGRRAAPGVYYLRLRLPGYGATREIVLAR